MPTRVSEDGIDLSRFLPGFDYEVGNRTGSLFLAEGWAVPVDADEPSAPVLPFRLHVTEPNEGAERPAVAAAADAAVLDLAVEPGRTPR